MDAHAVVGVLQATEVLVWSWSQHPPIVLPVDVEDALVPGLVLVDLPAMEGIVINITTIIIVSRRSATDRRGPAGDSEL